MSEQQQVTKEENICGPGAGWWRQDRLDAIGWAVLFIWGAIVMLANYGWGVFFAGAGVIVLLGTFIRLLIPQYRRSLVGGFIFGLILLAIGLGGWNWIWPLALIAIAITILVSTFAHKR